MGIVGRVLGDPHQRELRRLGRAVATINELEEGMRARSDAELRDLTRHFRERLGVERSDTVLGHPTSASAIDDWDDEEQAAEAKAEEQLREQYERGMAELLPEAFAAVREVARRTLGMRPYDVQMLGGIALHEGRIAEMRTGEGKTLVAALPLYLNALPGRGAHLVTVNEYLARRDAGWNGALYHALGMSVGVITSENSYLYDPDYLDDTSADERLHHLRPVTRREAYLADITYATNNELGFDYLRDNMARSLDLCVQRRLNYAIVDEVDSILVDEARTPLIISGPAPNAEEYIRLMYDYARIAKRLVEDEDYTVDEKTRTASLTDEGMAKVEEWTQIPNLYAPENTMYAHIMDRALVAHAIYKKDKDYIVRGDEIVIVDEFTGRTLAGRRWSHGIHQAIEAKEGKVVNQQDSTHATITFQNFFRLYYKLAGMTGTALTEAEEFHKIYKLDVLPIPTHQPVIRIDRTDKIYRTEEAKYKAIVAEVERRHLAGQPVLIGTTSVEKSEKLAGMLDRRGIHNEVLNAKRHEQESMIIAGAGQRGAVTIATNMAGRGTDIVLGEGVKELGGLYIIGTERHESRRIDNQLRGRAGRQGDPGETHFFLSYDDDVMRIFGGERMQSLMEKLGLDDDQPIQNRMVVKQLEGAQSRVEGHNFDIRRTLVQYDDVVSKQREAIYGDRRRILEGTDTRANIERMVEEVVALAVEEYCQGNHPESWDLSGLWSSLLSLAPLPPESEVDLDALRTSKQDVEDALVAEFAAIYSRREQEYGEELFRQFEQQAMLAVIDTRWQSYLNEIDELRDGIGFHSLGQMDPLIEFKQQGFAAFQEMKEEVKREIVRVIFTAQIQKVQAPQPPVAPEADAETAPLAGRADGALPDADDGMAPAARPGAAVASARLARAMAGAGIAMPAPARTVESVGGQKTVRTARGAAAAGGNSAVPRKLGRNEPCWCGSGQKYKRCHGA